jgi:hypothetical protein
VQSRTLSLCDLYLIASTLLFTPQSTMKERVAWLARRGRPVVRNCWLRSARRSLFLAAVCVNIVLVVRAPRFPTRAAPRAARADAGRCLQVHCLDAECVTACRPSVHGSSDKHSGCTMTQTVTVSRIPSRAGPETQQPRPPSPDDDDYAFYLSAAQLAHPHSFAHCVIQHISSHWPQFKVLEEQADNDKAHALR